MSLVKMNKLNNTPIYVNPHCVQSVTISYYSDKIIIKMTDGEVYEVNQEYGESVYETQEKIVNKLNAAIIEGNNE